LKTITNGRSFGIGYQSPNLGIATTPYVNRKNRWRAITTNHYLLWFPHLSILPTSYVTPTAIFSFYKQNLLLP